MLSSITYDTHTSKVKVVVKDGEATVTYDGGKDVPTFKNKYTPPTISPTTPPSVRSSSATAKTGDTTSMMPIIVLAVAGCAVITGSIIYRRRRSK